MIVTQADEKFAELYVSDEVGFREFWHAYISKRRLQRRKRSIVESFFGHDRAIVQQIEAYQEAESEAFSQATHPSFMAGIVQAFRMMQEVNGSEAGWEFLDSWMGVRPAVFIIDSISLAVSKLVINLMKDSESVQIIDSKLKLNTAEVLKVLLSATISCGSIGSQHHEKYPGHPLGA